jgi:hypothetical protein
VSILKENNENTSVREVSNTLGAYGDEPVIAVTTISDVVYLLRLYVTMERELEVSSGTLYDVALFRGDVSENLSPSSAAVLRLIGFHGYITVETLLLTETFFFFI